MSLRDRFVKAMRREAEDHVPLSANLCPSQMDRFEKEYGHRNVADEWGFPVRNVKLGFQATCDDFSPWLGEVNERTHVSEWGIGRESRPGSMHFTHLLHPLQNAKSAQEIRDYPFPEAPGADAVAQASEQCSPVHERGLAAMVATCPEGGTIFWPAYKLRGMENFLCDLHLEPEIAAALLEKVTELCVEHVRLAASTGADVIFMADDLGTQRATYMSRADFCRWIKPRLAQVIAAAKKANPDILLHFHSDGAVQDFIPDLIEIGVDILNPVQPECMDPLTIKRTYGDRLSLSGCVGTQTTLPFGTPDEVRDTVRLYCEEIGAGGGLWIAPTHTVEPEVPWENITAFVETAKEYDR